MISFQVERICIRMFFLDLLEGKADGKVFNTGRVGSNEIITTFLLSTANRMYIYILLVLINCTPQVWSC